MKLLIVRTVLIYLCVLFAMRLMGKRQLGELQPEELVSTILISNLASISIESEEVPVPASSRSSSLQRWSFWGLFSASRARNFST